MGVLVLFGGRRMESVMTSRNVTQRRPDDGRADGRARASRRLGIVVGLAAFSAAFVVLDQAYVHIVSDHVTAEDGSMAGATWYGLASRLHLILPLLVLALWLPRPLGFRVGRIRRNWRILLLFLVSNVGIVGGYLILSGNTTPYSGNEWLLTEVVIVPLLEETMWRGAVFAILLGGFRRIRAGNGATICAVWSSGLAFGLVHCANALVGIPGEFVAVQVLNAAVWGIVYGYARALTGSIYPPIVLHAAMNLVVVLL